MATKTTATKGGTMFGDLEFNLSEDRVTIDVRDDGAGAVGLGFDDGNMGLRVRLSKEQAAEISVRLDLAGMGDYKKKLLLDQVDASIGLTRR